MATNNVGTAPNLSLLSRGVGAVKRNGHERIDVHLEPEDYFNYIDSPRRFILPPLVDHQPPLQPKYAFEVSPRSNGSGPREFQEVALPKTFTTRKGALLLFSEEFAMKSGQDEFGEEFQDRHQHKETEEPDLKTVDDLARSILSYGSHRSEVHLKFVRDVATTRRVRPGFSARRYLSRLTRTFDDTFLDNLMAKGYVNEKTLFQSNSVRPNMRRRINDDLSYMPTPYRIMRQMLMAPGMLSGYSFSKSRTMDSELSGFSVIEEEDEGEVRKDPHHGVQVVEVKEGVPHTVLYGALSQEDKENVLADLLVKSAINHALDKQKEKLTEVREEEDTEVTYAKEMVRVSDPPTPRRASVTEFNMAEAVQSYLESQVDSASLADGSTTSQTGLRGGKVPPHSARSFEAHERPWPERQGEKEFIGSMPVIALRNPRSTGTTPSPANSRHPSASGSATAAPPDEQYAAPQKALTPIIDVSREVSLNPIPILPPIQGDKGHSRGAGKSDIKVPHLIFDPATPSTTRPHGTSSHPASAHPSLHDSVRSIEAHEAEGSRRGVGSDSRFSRKKGSQRSVVSLDSSASHISAGGLGGAGGYIYSSTESLNVDPAAREARGGAMRGKALKVGGDKSAASRKGVGSVKGPGSVKGSVVYGPHGEVMSVGGSILSRQPTPTDFHHSDPHVDTVSEPGNLQGSDDEEEWAGRRRSGVKSAAESKECTEDQMKDGASSTERDASLDTVAPSNPVLKSSETGDTLTTRLEEPELSSSMLVDESGEGGGQIADAAEHLKMASEEKTDDHKDGSEAGSLERSQGMSPERSHEISLERSVEGTQETPQQESQERSQEDLQQHSPLLSGGGTPAGNTNQNAVPSPDNRDPHDLLSTQEGEVTALSGGASNAPDQTLPAIMLKEATEHKTGASQSEHSSLAGENLAFDRPITEQELVKALSEHAHNIAMATLSRPGTGLDITTDAQVVIEQMLSGGMDAANPSVDEYKDMLRETLSSVVSKMSGGTPENFPQDVEVAPELIEALTQHQLSPDDIEVVQDDTGKSVIRVKSSASSMSKMESSGTAGDSTKEDVVKERFKDEKLRVGKLRSASILSGKNMTDQTAKGDVGSLDIINYGEKEKNEEEKPQVVVRPPQVGSEGDGDGDERGSKRSSAPNVGSGQQGKAGASGRSSQASTNKTVKDEDDDAKLRQLLETMVQPQEAKSPKLSGTVSTKTSAKSKKSSKSDKSKKSRKSGEKDAETKKALEDRDEFVVGKVDDKKELEMLYKPLEEPAKPKEKKPRVPQAKSPKKGKKKSSKKERESGESPASSSSKLPSPGPPVEAPPPKEAPPPSPPKSPSWHSEKTEEEEEMEFVFVRDEFDETPPPQTATKSKPKSPEPSLVDTEDSSLSDSDGESDISGHLKQISNKDARAAKRAAQAAKRREEVEKKRKEREESIRHEREEAERKDKLQRELEEDRKRREDEKRLKRERAEEELRRKELESQERARRARIDQEKEKRQKEEYQRKLVEMRRKQQEEERIRQEQEEERRKEEELRRIQEELMMSQMEEQERIEYEKKKKEEEERRKIEEEEAREQERIRREEEARIAMEEAKRLAEEMARKKAEFERRLQFNRGLQLESTGLEHTQDITRAFVFSYYEFLQWLGLEVPDFERLKKSMGM